VPSGEANLLWFRSFLESHKCLSNA